jgi:excisionase family DNA binding protein
MSASAITTEANEPPPLLLTVPQAARMLAISRSRVYQLIWKGELVPVHIGRSARFTVSELERFVGALPVEP